MCFLASSFAGTLADGVQCVPHGEDDREVAPQSLAAMFSAEVESPGKK
eukprot:COSAG06_NODE_54456_length_294_cov_1.051282_1_plen_47_part_10